jgi:hypothetical protein
MKRCAGVFCMAAAVVTLIGIGAVMTAKADIHQSLNKTFNANGLGCTIQYPEAWKATSEPGKVLFSGAKREKDVGPAVGIRNVKSTKVEGGRYKNIDELIGDIEGQLKSTDLKDVKVYPSQPYAYEKAGLKLGAKQFSAEYTYAGAPYRQWFVIVPRPDGMIFHLWYFVSDTGSYDKNAAIARAMLDSWVILK